MDIEVRPATKTEQMYCYTQSDQIMGQTGCIGHLRADMGDSGDQFFHDWTSHCERLLTPEFNDEFNQVINQLREDGGFLKSRAAVSAYCYRQIDSAIDLSDQDFAFRAVTKDYSYLLRLNPQKGMYTVYCYCYKREFLDHHLHQAEKGIRFITSDYTALFHLPDGGKIRILRQDGTHIDRVCRYIDDYHVEIGSSWDSIYHICQFAEQMERCHNEVIPLTPPLPEKCFTVQPSSGELIAIERYKPGYQVSPMAYFKGKTPQQTADVLNDDMGVTRAQAAAMLAGATLGWTSSAADPSRYNKRGRPIQSRRHERSGSR